MTATVLLLAGSLILVGATPALAGERSREAEIEVDWHEDGLGFNVTSSKEISNIIIEYCPVDDERRADKIEFSEPQPTTYNHTDDEEIVAIWVKAGDNHDSEDPEPPAPYNQGQQSGEHFENPFVDCEEEACVGPQEITGEALQNEVNRLNWTEFEDADFYTLYRAEDGGSHEAIANVTTTEYLDANVTQGSTYNYTVTATVDDEESERCDFVEIMAIPDLGSVFAVSAASIVGVGSYAAYRRRS